MGVIIVVTVLTELPGQNPVYDFPKEFSHPLCCLVILGSICQTATKKTQKNYLNKSQQEVAEMKLMIFSQRSVTDLDGSNVDDRYFIKSSLMTIISSKLL